MQLISNGVKAVVVAGWAVNDVAALSFAERFYDEMLQGNCFGDAVQQARACCFENHSEQNTWGAYQCYGDPFYKFNLRQAGKSSGFSYVVPEQAVIDLNNLLSEMHMESMKDDAALNRLKAISQQVEKDGIRDAAITEREAFVLAQLCQYQAALTRFDELFKMEQANFYAVSYTHLDVYKRQGLSLGAAPGQCLRFPPTVCKCRHDTPTGPKGKQYNDKYGGSKQCLGGGRSLFGWLHTATAWCQ